MSLSDAPDDWQPAEVRNALRDAYNKIHLAAYAAIRLSAADIYRSGYDSAGAIDKLVEHATYVLGLPPNQVHDAIVDGRNDAATGKVVRLPKPTKPNGNGAQREQEQYFFEGHPNAPREWKSGLKPDFHNAVLSGAEWLKRGLEPPDLVLGEWLSTTSRVMLFAPTGIGKSMFGIAAGMAGAAGHGFLHWQGHGPKRVLYVDGEMPRILLKERLIGEADRIGGMPATFHALSTEDVENFAPLNTEEGQQVIDAIIEKLGGLDLIIFDNIMSLIGGEMKDEESWRNAIPWQKTLTKRRIGQLWVHHTGHDTTKGYGTKTKEWQLDTVIGLQKTDREDIDVCFELEFQKARLRTPVTRNDFRKTVISLEDDQWLASESTGKGNRVDLTPTAQKYHEALANCDAHLVDGITRIKHEDWKREVAKKGLFPRTEEKSRNDLMSKYRIELVTKNWLVSNETHVWRTTCNR
jgi:hypothetical protein